MLWRVSLIWLWCKRKRWGFSSAGKYLYLYLYLVYKALVNISQKWKVKEDVREEKTSPVWCMHILVPKSVISLLYGGSCSFPQWWCLIICSWGLGSLCKVLDILQLSVLHVIFALAPINPHWWAHVFWSVARTNAYKWPLALVPVSYLDLLDKILLYQFVTVHVWCRMYVLWWNYL